jgi:hypothetical protein
MDANGNFIVAWAAMVRRPEMSMAGFSSSATTLPGQARAETLVNALREQ